MSDGIKDHFETMAEEEYQKERTALAGKKMVVLHKCIRETRDTLFRYLADDRPMTKFDRNRLEFALKNLQDLLK